jgi:hypothetical protein
MTSSTTIATHDEPAWRSRSDYIIFANLSEWSLDGWEQLWANRTGDDFIICCIPFFTYGIALGDTVCVGPSEGRDYVITNVRNKSGHRVARLWLKNATAYAREEVEKLLHDETPLCEHSSLNLLAIDVPDNSTVAARLCSRLEALARTHSIALEYGD